MAAADLPRHMANIVQAQWPMSSKSDDGLNPPPGPFSPSCQISLDGELPAKAASHPFLYRNANFGASAILSARKPIPAT